MPAFLMLRPGNPATFRRTVERNAKGESVRKVEFPPLTPVEVSDEDFIALEPDIGTVLVYAALEEVTNKETGAVSYRPLPRMAKNQEDPTKPKKKKK